MPRGNILIRNERCRPLIINYYISIFQDRGAYEWTDQPWDQYLREDPEPLEHTCFTVRDIVADRRAENRHAA